jgi:hypothetical protein
MKRLTIAWSSEQKKPIGYCATHIGDGGCFG